MSQSIAQRVAELGHTLPEVRPPVANYLSSTRAGNLLFIAGQIAQRDGEPAYIGRLGAALTLREGREAAALSALGLLAQIDAAVDGDAERVRRILRLGVFVAAEPGFDEHSQVANGASDLLVAVFGDAGRHARTAVGVSSLPAGVAVEIDAVVELVG
jgi:enamine deaminase RidA (YjgF/YER057c/UK114 family)